MRDTFYLKYSATSADLFRYNDSTWDNKRLWICRILTQFLMQEAVIISIDESAVKSSWLPPKTWQFSPPKRVMDLQEVVSKQSPQTEESKNEEVNPSISEPEQDSSFKQRLTAPFGRIS